VPLKLDGEPVLLAPPWMTSRIDNLLSTLRENTRSHEYASAMLAAQGNTTPPRPDPPFERRWAALLAARLREPRRFVQAIAGPRQVGKSTIVAQALARCGLPSVSVSADEPTVTDRAWLIAQWDRARQLAAQSPRTGNAGAVLVLDEVQKLPAWSDIVKAQWDADTRSNCPLHVVLLGSAPLLVQRGLGDSLAGRFELLHIPHWSFAEMRAAFGFTLEQYVIFGGYPGAAPFIAPSDAAATPDPSRWRRYILDSLIETSIARDILLMNRIDKPALLRLLFDLGCRYSGQILSYTKMLGQLHDAGNTTTLAHYLELLAGAGMLCGIEKFARGATRRRASSPKLQVMNTALMTALSGASTDSIRADHETWGRLVESAVGAHLINGAVEGEYSVHYWRDRGREVDFVVSQGEQLTAIEVKSGKSPEALPGLNDFCEAFQPTRTLLIGGDGITLEEFLASPVERWVDVRRTSR
jgi:predicted AAA+ superfamily ATPase